MYGNIILKRSTVNSNFCGLEIKPGALIYINQGAPKIPSRVIMTKNIPSKVATLLINRCNSNFVFFSLYSDKIGIKD